MKRCRERRQYGRKAKKTFRSSVGHVAPVCDAQLVVADMCPLRPRTQWREAVARGLPEGCGFHVVDAHNIVPLWEASPKQEYAARTIRPHPHP